MGIKIKDINELKLYLSLQSANTKDTPYLIELKIDNESNFLSLNTVLKNETDKFIYLNLSESTIDTIPSFAFSESNIFYKDEFSVISKITGCSTLVGISIPATVTYIGKCAFYGCGNLKGITLSDSVKNIKYGAFKDCRSLECVNIGNSTKKISSHAFSNCIKLTSINVSDGNSTYTDEDGILYNKSKTTLIHYPIGKKSPSFIIPNSVKRIGNNAFTLSNSLENITIPRNVISIGYWAFYGCIRLKNITMSKYVRNIGNTAFSESGLTNVTIPEGVTVIEYQAFQCCTNLVSVTIPNSVRKIEKNTFSGCTNLVSVTIPNSVTSIEMFAFQNCNSLTDLNIGKGVTNIGAYAFSFCSSLTSLTIPKNITVIDYNAFTGCTSLKSVIFQGTIISENFDKSTQLIPLIDDISEKIDSFLGYVTDEDLIPINEISEPEILSPNHFSQFPGNLRDKFYETDPTNGTPGTYTTLNPGDKSIWTRK
jgi:predicted transport protein